MMIPFGFWGSKQGIVTDGLLLWLDASNPASYPGSGTTWSDLSGNNNDGTLLNGVTYDSNLKALVFDGNDDSVQTTLGADINHLFCDSTNEFTVVSVFKPNSANGVICGAAGGVGAASTFVKYISGTDDLGVSLRGTANFLLLGISSSVFYVWTVTWDGTTARSYINNNSSTTLNVGAVANQQWNFGIGDPTNGRLTNYQRYDGPIGASLIYDRAITSDEVIKNYKYFNEVFN